MKTALQELIERLDKTEKQLDKENNLVMSSALFAAKSMALESLEKEKEQIKKANMDGYKEGCTYHSFDHRPKTTEEYYNQTYNQNK